MVKLELVEYGTATLFKLNNKVYLACGCQFFNALDADKRVQKYADFNLSADEVDMIELALEQELEEQPINDELLKLMWAAIEMLVDSFELFEVAEHIVKNIDLSDKENLRRLMNLNEYSMYQRNSDLFPVTEELLLRFVNTFSPCEWDFSCQLEAYSEMHDSSAIDKRIKEIVGN